jgi:hypothetical protein
MYDELLGDKKKHLRYSHWIRTQLPMIAHPTAMQSTFWYHNPHGLPVYDPYAPNGTHKREMRSLYFAEKDSSTHHHQGARKHSKRSSSSKKQNKGYRVVSGPPSIVRETEHELKQTQTQSSVAITKLGLGASAPDITYYRHDIMDESDGPPMIDENSYDNNNFMNEEEDGTIPSDTDSLHGAAADAADAGGSASMDISAPFNESIPISDSSSVSVPVSVPVPVVSAVGASEAVSHFDSVATYPLPPISAAANGPLG